MNNKNNLQKTVAIMYDFDFTLSPNNMQEFSFFSLVNLTSDEFWNKTYSYGTLNNMDSTLAYLYQMIKSAKDQNIPLTLDLMRKCGENIEFFPGVIGWFERINEYGKSRGLNVEHYIISSGNEEIIEGTKIYKYFKRLYGCRFIYNENNEAYWPSKIVNYTTKTQFIFRIRKNKLDNLFDSKSVNEKIYDDNLVIPFSNLIYIGDGDTDIPCMKILHDNGGHSFCVYDETSKKRKLKAEQIFNEKRVNYFAPANYEKDSIIDKKIKSIIDNISKTI